MVGGFGGAVAQALASFGIPNERFTLPKEFLPAGDPRWLLSYCLLDADSVVERIVKLLHL